MLPLEGRILDGKFRFVRMLGEGGMGAVWRAENVLVKKTVAIKLMHIQFSKDEGVLARFRNEATAAGRIGSAHICDILDLGRSDLGPYIVMEMLRGRDLSGFLQHRQGRVDPGLSVLIVREALEGLGAAHQVGIVHRDLKPENIFLHEPKPGELMVKLMDFGISKFTEGSEAGKTGIGVLMGTPEYMSPEQTEGAAQVDHRTDIWAMGVILYWALSGRNPFLGPTMAATLVNVSTKQPPSLTSLGPHIHPDLVAVIDRCIRKNPAERWASCEEMAAALAPFEDRNNGVYVVSGASASAPSGPGRTMASATPPPGATVAASPSGLAGIAPTMMGAVTGTGVANPGTGPGPVAGAGPTFVGAAPSGASGGGGNSPTWSNEFQGTAGAAPTIGGDSTFGLGADHLEQRPDSSLGSGSKVGTLVILAVLLAALGGGGWFAYQEFVVRKQGSDVAAGEDDGAAADGKAAGDGNAVADGTPVEDDAGAEAGAAESGTSTGAVVAGGSDASSAGSTEGSGSTGGDAADDDPGDTGAETTTGAAEAGTTAAADDAGADDGGHTDPKPPTTKKPDLSKVRKSGKLYGLKGGRAALTSKTAKSVCGSLRRTKFANLGGWRVPSTSELNKFSAKAGPGKYWLKDGRYYNTAGRKVVGALKRVPGAKVLCVSR